jgi:hypothetical protein
MQWQPINTVPLDRDVEIAVADSQGSCVVACPCRLTERGWIAAESKRRLYWVRPTHWRDLSAKEKTSERAIGLVPTAYFNANNHENF